MAMADARKVPATRGRTPKCFSENSGVHSVPKTNSPIGTSRRKASVSKSRTKIIPAVIRMDPAAHKNRAFSITNSTIVRVRNRVTGRILLRKPLFQGDLAMAVRSLVHRPGFPAREPGPNQLVFAGLQRDVTHLLGQRVPLRQIEVDEALHLRTVERHHLRIDENRS